MKTSKSKQMCTRMAPSPTGKFHVGGARTTLYNYLFARQNGGKFILRSEDTDKERSRPEHEENMLESLRWLGLEHDEFYRQSERTDIYREQLQKLIDAGKAYEAEESKTDSGKKVIRFKNPNHKITFQDQIFGEITQDTTELGDFVIARDIDTPLYHLTVVVDDGLMNVTHVIRGQEHIMNTPRQILILEALDFERPTYAHLPLIMSPRGGKLSKRDPEVVPLLEYREQGILPEALNNFLAFIGWNPGTEQELFSLPELIKEFDLKKIQKSGGVFNIDKLYWFNRAYIKKLPEADFLERVGQFWPAEWGADLLEKLAPILRERINKFADIATMKAAGEFDYYLQTPQINKEKLIWKKSTPKDTKENLEAVLELLSTTNFSTAEEMKTILWPLAEERGRGDVLWPVRYALTGAERSPDPFAVGAVLGKEEVLKRLKNAIMSL